MQQNEKPQRVNELQVFERCLKIVETLMERADEQHQARFQRVTLNVKNQFASDPRKAPCKVLQTLDENPAQ